MLYVRLVHLHEEVLDPVVILDVVQADEAHAARGDERGDVPLVEFVHQSEVHVAGGPHGLVDEVQGCVGDELVQVAMILALGFFIGWREFHFEHGIVFVPHDGEVVVP